MEKRTSTQQKFSELSHRPEKKLCRSAAWLAGTAAICPDVGASTVQIRQINNAYNGYADNLQADLTGDGIDDLPGLYGSSTFTATYTPGSSYYRRLRQFVNTSALGRQWWGSHVLWAKSSTVLESTYRANISNANATHQGENFQGITELVPVSFSDARINAGATTDGLLEVFVEVWTGRDFQIKLVRLIFDDESTNEPAGAVSGETYPRWIPGAVDDTVDEIVENYPTYTDAQKRAAVAKLKKLKNGLKKLKKKLRKTLVDDNGRKIKIIKNKIKKAEKKYNAQKKQVAAIGRRA